MWNLVDLFSEPFYFGLMGQISADKSVWGSPDIGHFLLQLMRLSQLNSDWA